MAPGLRVRDTLSQNGFLPPLLFMFNRVDLHRVRAAASVWAIFMALLMELVFNAALFPMQCATLAANHPQPVMSTVGGNVLNSTQRGASK